MSLIERAVARMGETATPEAGTIGGVDAPAAAELRTAIEKLADRRRSGYPIEGAPEIHDPHSAHFEAATSRKRTVRIDLDALRARGMVVPDGMPTPVAQQFRVIKRPLLVNAFGGAGKRTVPNGRRLMITSAFPGEGKSFCSINLAMSIAAERDHGVLLVDADVARPAIPRQLGIDTDAGLIDWLLDGSPDLSQLVLDTNVDTLSILPAGRRHDRTTELLASDGMSRLLDELTHRYPDRIIICDAPPLLVTTEARVLASHMGQIVLVVEAGKTPREMVTQALSTIESCEVVGLVLNKAPAVETGGYYAGYGYGAA